MSRSRSCIAQLVRLDGSVLIETPSPDYLGPAYGWQASYDPIIGPVYARWRYSDGPPEWTLTYFYRDGYPDSGATFFYDAQTNKFLPMSPNYVSFEPSPEMLALRVLNEKPHETAIDWREAFIKYVRIVADNEGVTFLNRKDWLPHEWSAINAAADEEYRRERHT